MSEQVNNQVSENENKRMKRRMKRWRKKNAWNSTVSCLILCAVAKSRCRCEQLRWDWRLGNFQYKKWSVSAIYMQRTVRLYFFSFFHLIEKRVCFILFFLITKIFWWWCFWLLCWATCFCITSLSSTPSDTHTLSWIAKVFFSITQLQKSTCKLSSSFSSFFFLSKDD